MPNHKSFYEEYWRERMALDRSHDTGRSRRIDLACSRVAAGDQVLDFGCGIGDFTVPLLEAGALVSAVDVSERAVERARKRAPAADFGVVVPGHDLPYGDEQFDWVVAMEVIEHVFDTHGLFQEFRRVLKPQGRLLLSCPYHGLVKNLLVSLLWFEEHFRTDHPHIRFYTVRSLRWLLHQHGFAVGELRRLGRMWPIYRTVFVEARKVDVGEGLRTDLTTGLVKRVLSRLFGIMNGTGAGPSSSTPRPAP